MGTSGTQYRRTHRKLGHGLFRSFFRCFPSQKIGQCLADAVTGVLPCCRHIVRQLSLDCNRKMIFSTNENQAAFQNWIQFLHAEHFVQAAQKFQRRFFRERKRRSDPENTGC